MIETCERLLAEESSNLMKMEAVLEKANKYKFKHQSIDDVSRNIWISLWHQGIGI